MNLRASLPGSGGQWGAAHPSSPFGDSPRELAKPSHPGPGFSPYPKDTGR